MRPAVVSSAFRDRHDLTLPGHNPAILHGEIRTSQPGRQSRRIIQVQFARIYIVDRDISVRTHTEVAFAISHADGTGGVGPGQNGHFVKAHLPVHAAEARFIISPLVALFGCVVSGLLGHKPGHHLWILSEYSTIGVVSGHDGLPGIVNEQ